MLRGTGAEDDQGNQRGQEEKGVGEGMYTLKSGAQIAFVTQIPVLYLALLKEVVPVYRPCALLSHDSRDFFLFLWRQNHVLN